MTSETTSAAPLSKEGQPSSLALVGLCFFFSGLAALLYQTAWMRQFATVFGTSEPAVAAVLAAYMSGLALGAAAAGKWLTRVTRPILVYGLLELGIALGALALPVGLQFARAMFRDSTGGLAELPDAGGSGQFGFYLAMTFVLVLIPTSFMGATLPLLARHAVRRESEIGKRIGSLYAINTVGAVIGTVVAAFILLPSIGLQATVWIGVAINAVVFLLAVAVSKKSGTALVEDAGEPEKSSLRSFVLPLIALSGAVAFTYEVLWTRLFSHLLGGSVYAFATMLASFLSGIAIGSAIASRQANTREQAIRGFAFAQFGVGISSLVIFLSLGILPGLQLSLGAGEDASVIDNAFLSALVLLPSTLFLGATFPFAVKIAATSAADAGSAAARVFSWNTVGATVGALAAGFWILPTFGFEGAIRLCVLANLGMGLFVFFLAPSSSRQARIVAVVSVLAVAVFFRPAPPMAILSASPFAELTSQDEPVWSQVGSTCSAMVLKRNDEYQVRINGLPQALIVPLGAPPMYGVQSRWLTALPLLARPNAKSICVIGLGGGVALEAIPASVEDIDVIELSPEVVEANRFLSSLRNSDPLADPRLHIVENDARSALERTSKQWDIIVSQPSHPWTAGASHLFTREFAQLVKERLTPDGVFLQWVATRSFDMDLVATYSATLLSEFEHVRLYQSSTVCPMFLASNEPLNIEETMIDSPGLLASAPDYTDWLGVTGPESVAARMTIDTNGLRALCENVEPNTDDENRLAMSSPNFDANLEGVDMEAVLAPYVDRDIDPRLDRVEIIRSLLELNFIERAYALAGRIEDPSERAYAEFVVASRVGNQDVATAKLAEAFELDSEDPRIAFQVVATQTSATMSPEALRAQKVLSPAGKTAIEGWPLMMSKKWKELEALDQDLAKTLPNQPSYLVALQLRAAWRVRGNIPSAEVRERALEAIKFADQGVAVNANLPLLVLRVEAASKAKEPDALLETASILLSLFQNMAPELVAQVYAADTQRVSACLRKLERDERADQQRISSLRAQYKVLGKATLR